MQHLLNPVLASKGLLGIREHVFLCLGVSPGQAAGYSWACPVLALYLGRSRLGRKLGYWHVSLLLIPATSWSQFSPPPLSSPSPPHSVLSSFPSNPLRQLTDAGRHLSSAGTQNQLLALNGFSPFATAIKGLTQPEWEYVAIILQMRSLPHPNYSGEYSRWVAP